MMPSIEDAQVGYPGFRVTRPPRVKLTGAALKRVALAKLSSITLISAEFGGERFVFSPWLTVLIDHGDGALLKGLYRTDSQSPEEREPNWCLRGSVWDRALDHTQAQQADDLRGYLAGGPQLSDRIVFANRHTHPEIEPVMENAISALTSPGITVSPSETRTHPWHQVELELADDRLICRIGYSPLLARSHQLEAALPPLLDRLDELLDRDGLPADDEVTISISRSVVELVDAESRSLPEP